MIVYVYIVHTVPLTISYQQTLVSDWLKFCCENLILGQKKKKQNDKKTNFMMRNIRKCEWKHKIAFFKLSWPHWPVMQHIYNSREMEKIEMIWNCRCCQQVISPRIMHFLLDFVQYLLFEYEQSRIRMWVDRLF